MCDNLIGYNWYTQCVSYGLARNWNDTLKTDRLNYENQTSKNKNRSEQQKDIKTETMETHASETHFYCPYIHTL